MLSISSVIRLMRPRQYIKNSFILLPLFFAIKIMDMALLYNALLAFLAFSLLASAMYVFNDYCDIDDDRQHPNKKNRPIASGHISQLEALVIMVVLLIAGFAISYQLSMQATYLVMLYVGLNVAYSMYLKRVALVDVTIIAIGFVLRLLLGSVVTDIHLSMWIIIMTFLLALFLALAKRRDDVLIFQLTGKKMRKVIDGYNLQFLDSAMVIMASVVIVCYTIYSTSSEIVQRPNGEYLYLTAFFVILGIFRYMQITFVEQNSGSPTRIILTDVFIQITLLGWLASFVWILY